MADVALVRETRSVVRRLREAEERHMARQGTRGVARCVSRVVSYVAPVVYIIGLRNISHGMEQLTLVRRRSAACAARTEEEEG